MTIQAQLSATHYYNSSPTSKHSTGDIWRGVPTFGLLKHPECSGLVITPACDLANQKADTITYLPIIPVSHYLCTSAFYSELRTTLTNCLAQLEKRNRELPRTSLPTLIEIADLEAIADSFIDGKQRDTAKRLRIGLEHLRTICKQTPLTGPSGRLQEVFAKKDWDRISTGIVRNSYRPDIHFLPSDQQHPTWSAIPSHSVVLFRYPITVPIAGFDLANEIQVTDWNTSVTNLSETITGVRCFERQPLKCLTLKPAFLNDLLTRFVALYIRIGSPDFTAEAVETLSAQL